MRINGTNNPNNPGTPVFTTSADDVMAPGPQMSVRQRRHAFVEEPQLSVRQRRHAFVQEPPAPLAACPAGPVRSPKAADRGLDGASGFLGTRLGKERAAGRPAASAPPRPELIAAVESFIGHAEQLNVATVVHALADGELVLDEAAAIHFFHTVRADIDPRSPGLNNRLKLACFLLMHGNLMGDNGTLMADALFHACALKLQFAFGEADACAYLRTIEALVAGELVSEPVSMMREACGRILADTLDHTEERRTTNLSTLSFLQRAIEGGFFPDRALAAGQLMDVMIANNYLAAARSLLTRENFGPQLTDKAVTLADHCASTLGKNPRSAFIKFACFKALLEGKLLDRMARADAAQTLLEGIEDLPEHVCKDIGLDRREIHVLKRISAPRFRPLPSPGA